MFMLPFGLLIPDLLINFAWQIFAPSPSIILMRHYKDNPQSEVTYNALSQSSFQTINTTNVVMKNGGGTNISKVNPVDVR
jgi:hypothetical protein